ncbi:metalloregulator ArsR/SmtB family transcription factor [Metasolibacillus sp. FSL H7-0170]|uniref:ArsR/SmtB family transcription factor n=1 Tax=Metasolibacillus TaxID=2703677 RepID=UPI000D360C02|nr:metalloregulator ArsR/SmtB family transcription factor [Metasolibacillus fluoroglycofenilyticus]
MVDERQLKNILYQEFARIGKCVSSPKRLEILDLLQQGPKSVEALSKTTGMSIANVSQHLQVLYGARLVKFKKDGNYVIYELASIEISHFLDSLFQLSERQYVEVRQIKEEFLNNTIGLEGISLSELKEKMESGQVLLLDVRPKEEYEAAHIPGAISIPIEELEEHLSSLPVNCEIVAYCRGPYCLMSAKAVEILNSNGIHAMRLQESVQDWMNAIN